MQLRNSIKIYHVLFKSETEKRQTGEVSWRLRWRWNPGLFVCVLCAAYSKNIRNKRNERTFQGRGNRGGQILSLGMGCTHAEKSFTWHRDSLPACVCRVCVRLCVLRC